MLWVKKYFAGKAVRRFFILSLVGYLNKNIQQKIFLLTECFYLIIISLPMLVS